MAAKRSGAGSLNCLVTFQRRVSQDDGYGNPISGPWQDEFTEPARLEPRLGNETVIAARLQGTQPYTMVVRNSERTRQITPAWRAYDARAGLGADGNPKRTFNIKTVANVDERNAYLDLLVVQDEPS